MPRNVTTDDPLTSRPSRRRGTRTAAAATTKQTGLAEISLASHGTPSTRTNHSLKVRARTTTGATGTLRVALYEGATNRSGNLETAVLTTSLADYTLTISDAAAATITDYSNLSVKIWGFDAANNPLVFEVAKLNLTVPPVSTAVDAPIAPSASRYTIPAGATVVTTQAQLDTALAGGTAVDIKVMNGTYSRATEASIGAAHRIWCESATGVVFNYGFDFASKVGWEFHGGKFLIPDTAHATQAAGFYCALTNWGGGSNAKISDVTIDGAGVCYAGVRLPGVSGADVRRVLVTNMTDFGVFISANDYYSTLTVAAVSDINCSAIHRSTYGAAGGTAEAGLWLGNQCLTPVRRMKFRDLGWMGLWTGSHAWDTAFSDIDVDDTHSSTGVYIEHNTINCSFDRMLIGSGCPIGVIAEWDYGTCVGLSGSHTLPVGTITVNESTASFPASGTLSIGDPAATPVTVTYTGKTAFTFTGCTGGTGTWASGTLVLKSRTSLPAWNCSFTNSQINSTGIGIVLDNGTMQTTVTGCTFTNCSVPQGSLPAAAILDRTNNPQATGSGNSKLTQSGNSFGSTPGVVYG